MSMSQTQTINERLKIAIEEAGLSQRQFAFKLGLAPTSISSVVNGRNFLQFDLAVKACEILGITMDWLAWGRPEDRLDSILTQLNTADKTGKRARIEYLMKIIEQLETGDADEVYEFSIYEVDKKIRAVVDRKKKTVHLDESNLSTRV